jgi:HAMP domain-containing protein
MSIDAADSIAEGNMNITLDTEKKDETGMLMKAMKTMADNIKGRLAKSRIFLKMPLKVTWT